MLFVLTFKQRRQMLNNPYFSVIQYILHKFLKAVVRDFPNNERLKIFSFLNFSLHKFYKGT